MEIQPKLSPSMTLVRWLGEVQQFSNGLRRNTNAPQGGCGCFGMNGAGTWVAFNDTGRLAIVGEVSRAALLQCSRFGYESDGDFLHCRTSVQLAHFWFNCAVRTGAIWRGTCERKLLLHWQRSIGAFAGAWEDGFHENCRSGSEVQTTLLHCHWMERA